jgi:hypothetical protein
MRSPKGQPALLASDRRLVHWPDRPFGEASSDRLGTEVGFSTAMLARQLTLTESARTSRLSPSPVVSR